MVKPALGRGLGALLGGTPVAKPPVTTPISTDGRMTPSVTPVAERVQRVPLDRIRPCPFQPRKDFSAEALAELASSIREQGVIQPLVVREVGGIYELIAGERRWRAAQTIGLSEIPVIVREADDRTVLELALIENLQRENLNPLEEAEGYAQLTSQFFLTQEEAALKVGKSRSVVTNSLRLLKLPLTVQKYIREGKLAVGHAKAIAALPDALRQERMAERIVKEGLNVRQTEALIAKVFSSSPSGNTVQHLAETPKPADAHVKHLEDQLREKLGTKVQLHYAQGKGALEIAFFSDAELERLLGILGISAA